MRSARYTDEEFIEAWNSSLSKAAVARKIGLAPKGGNYRTIDGVAKRLGLTPDHMTGQGHLRGKNHSYNKRPLSEILLADSPYNSTALRKRLISEGIFEHKCYCCGITDWMGQPAPLELEHVNGNHFDNRLENLTLLCPNCHAQTPTYRGKNQARVGQRRAGVLKIPVEDESVVGSTPTTRTCGCGNKLARRSKQCKECYNDKRAGKIEWPSYDEVQKMVKNTSYVKVGDALGVSDNAVRKYLDRMAPK